jgi:hypothetical protein
VNFFHNLASRRAFAAETREKEFYPGLFGDEVEAARLGRQAFELAGAFAYFNFLREMLGR